MSNKNFTDKKNRFITCFYGMVQDAGIRDLFPDEGAKYPLGLDSLMFLPKENWKVLASVDFDEDFWSEVRTVDDLIMLLDHEGFLDFQPYASIDGELSYYGGEPCLVLDAFRVIRLVPSDNSIYANNSKKFVICPLFWELDKYSYSSCDIIDFDPTSELAANRLLTSLLRVVATCPKLLKASCCDAVVEYYYAICKYLGVAEVPDRRPLEKFVRGMDFQVL